MSNVERMTKTTPTIASVRRIRTEILRPIAELGSFGVPMIDPAFRRHQPRWEFSISGVCIP